MDRTVFPNATQFPNVLTDQLMPLVSGNEWKVIHYGVRYAVGHRSTDTLTIAQIAHGRQAEDGTWVDRGTGLDEADVKECLAFLCETVHIFLREDRPRKPHGYRLNPDLVSINWDSLQRRQGGQQEAQSSAASIVEPSAVVRPPARFMDVPKADVTLDGSDRPVIEQLRGMLSREEGQAFDYLLGLAERADIGPVEDVAWVLYKLWRAYGFRRLQNAFQSPGTTSLDAVSKSCLVSVVAEMLETEKFGPITQSLRDKLVVMAEEWPVLDEWQDAIRSAVMYNSRRLATVEKNLKRKRPGPLAEAPGVSSGAKDDARSTAPAQKRQRSARRQSEWSSDELRAGRDADDDKEWPNPIG